MGYINKRVCIMAAVLGMFLLGGCDNYNNGVFKGDQPISREAMETLIFQHYRREYRTGSYFDLKSDIALDGRYKTLLGTTDTKTIKALGVTGAGDIEVYIGPGGTVTQPVADADLAVEEILAAGGRMVTEEKKYRFEGLGEYEVLVKVLQVGGVPLETPVGASYAVFVVTELTSSGGPGGNGGPVLVVDISY